MRRERRNKTEKDKVGTYFAAASSSYLFFNSKSSDWVASRAADRLRWSVKCQTTKTTTPPPTTYSVCEYGCWLHSGGPKKIHGGEGIPE